MFKQGLFQDFAQEGAKTKQAANFKWGYPPPPPLANWLSLYFNMGLPLPLSPHPWDKSTPWSPEINLI